MADETAILKLVTTFDGSSVKSGMNDVKTSIRTSAQEIREDFKEVGAGSEYSMIEARHSVMLLGEEFGIRLPRAVSGFIAGIAPLGALLEAAFPFLAIAAGATILIEHFSKLREEAEKLERDQYKFGETSADVFTHLGDKILEADIKIDELNDNHLGALQKQLELIDHQSMKELVSQFDLLAKAADAIFSDLKAHWYNFGSGSEGAKHALEDFKSKYDLLVAQDKPQEATDLLAGTLSSAKKVLELQKQAKESQAVPEQGKLGDYDKFVSASNALKQEKIGFTQREVEAQERLVDTLEAQLRVEEQVKELNTKDKEVATGRTDKQLEEQADRAAKQQAEAEAKTLKAQETAQDTARKEAISDLQDAEKEKIEVLGQGSAERLAAIDEAIKEEESKGLQDTGYYKSLLRDRLSEGHAEAEKRIKDVEEVSKAQAKAAQQSIEENQKQLDDQHKQDEELLKSKTAQGVSNAGGKGGVIGSVVELGAAQGEMQQLMAMESSFAEQSIANARAASAAKIAEIDKVEAAASEQLKAGLLNQQDYDAKIKQLETQRQSEFSAEKNKEVDITRQAQNKEFQYEQQYAKQVEQTQNEIATKFASSVDNMIFHSKNMHDAVRKLWQSMAEGMIEKLVQVVSQWITQHLIMTAINKVFHIQDMSETIAADEAQNATTAAANDAQITSYAGLAAAAAYAAYAEVPPVAAAMAAQAAATVESFTALGSAAGGYDVPGGGGTFPTILHPKEMVLPADLAGGVRNMVKSGTTTTSTNQGNSVSIGRLIFSPTVNGEFDAKTQGDQFFNHVVGKLRRMGMSLPG